MRRTRGSADVIRPFPSMNSFFRSQAADSHLRLVTNTDSANRAGLRFDAKFLALARVVRDETDLKEG
jgi:hypothetical protein